MNARAPITLIALLAIASTAFAQDVKPIAEQVADQDARHPAAPPAAPPAAQPEFTTAEQVLDALENLNISKLSASVRYTKISEFLGEREMRLGKMQFTSTPREGKADRKKFGVAFEKLFIGDMQDDQPKIYIFDGHWFVEKMPNEKLIIKREVVREGDEIDPLRLGEGPFPIPIGQKKAEILRHFNAELLPADDGLALDPNDPDAEPEAIAEARSLVRFAAGSHQIRLVPRTELDGTLDLAEVRLWYKLNKDGVLVPRLARAVDIDGNVSIVQLINVKLDGAAEIDEELFDVKVPENWDSSIREFGG